MIARVDQVQNYLGRQILIENPSSYLQFEHSQIAEWDFLAALSRNPDAACWSTSTTFTSAPAITGSMPVATCRRCRPAVVQELHLAGHSRKRCRDREILIDTHSAPVCDEVWALYEFALAMFRADADPHRVGCRHARARGPVGGSRQGQSPVGRGSCSRCVKSRPHSAPRSARTTPDRHTASGRDGGIAPEQRIQVYRNNHRRRIAWRRCRPLSGHRAPGRGRLVSAKRGAIPGQASFPVRRSAVSRRRDIPNSCARSSPAPSMAISPTSPRSSGPISWC